jgi:hypothetical protein
MTVMAALERFEFLPASVADALTTYAEYEIEFKGWFEWRVGDQDGLEMVKCLFRVHPNLPSCQVFLAPLS